MDKFKIPQDEKIPEQNQRILDELKWLSDLFPMCMPLSLILLSL